MSTADTPINAAKLNTKSTRVPKKLTPHSLRIIRLLASGKTKAEVATEVGSSYQYIYRLMSTQMAKDEFAKISSAVEAATISQIASTNSGVDSPISTALTAEVDATVLESIQKLRSIMNSPTTSPTAQALAAKELLDLSQAKKRLALLDKGLEDGVEVSQDDIALLASTVKDLRVMHLSHMRTPADRATALRRFSASDAEIDDSLPEEMAQAAPSPTDVAIDGEFGTAALPTGQSGTTGSAEEQGPTLPPLIPTQGPTIDDMLSTT